MHNFNVNNENGRSMIEMLGVLAIIGVLSVGGIAGYSKAMMKYKINKTIEQITLIAGNIRTFFANQGNYIGLSCRRINGSYKGQSDGDGCPIIKKAKILPDEMVTLDADGKITAMTNVFGGNFEMEGFDNRFRVELTKLPAEACIELALQDWSINSGAVKIDIYDGCDYRAYAPIDDLNEIVKICENMANEEEDGYFSLDFYPNESIPSGGHTFEEDC